MGEKMQSTVKEDRATSRMPNKTEIQAKAIELFHLDRFRNGDPSFNITPTEQELKENGYWQCAVSELMRTNHRSEIESDYIDFPQDFSVNIEQLFQSNGLILGSRHTGKSDLAMLISDVAMRDDAIVAIFDLSKDWVERSSIKQYMKIEPHTIVDVPNESIVFDLSLLSPTQQQATLERFSRTLFENQAQTQHRKQYLVICEEAHTYFYQGVMRSKNAVNSVRLLSVGRNVDVSCLLISQFASMLDKFCVKHSTSQVWLGFTREPNDLKYLRQFLGSQVELLPKLNDGEFLYLTRKGTQKIAIEPFESNISKVQIVPKIEPIQPIPTLPKTNSGALKAIIMSALLLLAISYGLGQMAGMM